MNFCMASALLTHFIKVRLPRFCLLNPHLLYLFAKRLVLADECLLVRRVLLCVHNNLLRNGPDLNLPLFALTFAGLKHGLMVFHVLLEVVKCKQFFVEAYHDVLYVFVFSIKLKDLMLKLAKVLRKVVVRV